MIGYLPALLTRRQLLTAVGLVAAGALSGCRTAATQPTATAGGPTPTGAASPTQHVVRDVLSEEPPLADARIAYGAEELQFGDLRLPQGAGPHPVVVMVHGGFWRAAYDLEHTGHLCAALTARGIATWNIEYRRLGNPGGGWPGTFQDVAQGADYVRELAKTYPLDLERVVALGHSAGGHLALWLAARGKLPADSELFSAEPLQLLASVPLAGVVDLRRGWELRLSGGVVEQLMGGSPQAVPARYAAGSPAELVPLGVRQVLIHGSADDTVPASISAGYVEVARQAGDDAELIELPATGHFEVITPGTEAWGVIEEQLVKLLQL